MPDQLIPWLLAALPKIRLGPSRLRSGNEILERILATSFAGPPLAYVAELKPLLLQAILLNLKLVINASHSKGLFPHLSPSRALIRKISPSHQTSSRSNSSGAIRCNSVRIEHVTDW